MRYFVVLPILLLIFPSFVCVSIAGEEVEVTSDNLSFILNEIDTTTDTERKKDLMRELWYSNIFNNAVENSLIGALNDSDSEVRKFAINILPSDLDPSLFPYLERLVDTDPETAAEASEKLKYAKQEQYEKSRSFEDLNANLFSNNKDARDRAIDSLISYHKNNPRTRSILMGFIRNNDVDSALKISIILRYGENDVFNDYQDELYQITRSFLFNKTIPEFDRQRMLYFMQSSFIGDDFSDFLRIINDVQESNDFRHRAMKALIKILSNPSLGITLVKELNDQFEKEGNMVLLGIGNLELKNLNEQLEEDMKNENKKITEEVMLPCTEASRESHLEEMAKNVSEIAERLGSSSPAENQRKNDANDRELIRIHSEDKEIEKQLRNAVEGYEIATQQFEVAAEPIVKEIIRLRGEIYGPAPLTVKRALTEVAETFKVAGSLSPILKEIIEFRTNEDRQMEIRKKEFEIRKKEREILEPAMEELKTAYNEVVRFFNSYRSSGEKSFPYMYLNERELLKKSQEMLSEFSNFRSN